MGRKSVTRRDGEFVVLPDHNVNILLRQVGREWRLIIDAPDEVRILRGEQTGEERFKRLPPLQGVEYRRRPGPPPR